MAIEDQNAENQGWTLNPVEAQPVASDDTSGWTLNPATPSARPKKTPAAPKQPIEAAQPDVPAFEPAAPPAPTPKAVVPTPAQEPAAPKEMGFFERLGERWYDTPSQGFMGAAAAKYYDWTNYGHDILKKKFPNKSEAEIEILADNLITDSRKKLLQEIETRQSANPAWRPDESFVSNFLSPERWVPALTGTLLGSASPVDFIAPGTGGVATRLGVAGGVNAAEDLATQGLDVSSGVQEEYDPTQTAASAALGAGLQAGFELPKALYDDFFGPGKVRPTLTDKVNANKTGQESAPASKTDTEILRDFEVESSIADMVEQGASAEQVMQAFPEYYAANPDASAITQQWVDYKAGGGEERMRFRDDVNEAELFEEAFSKTMDEAGLPGVSNGTPTRAPVANAVEGAPALRVDAEEAPSAPLKPRQQEVYDDVLNITKNWSDTPVFEVVDSVDDLPAPLRNTMYADGAETAPAFVGPDGKVRLIASNIPDKPTLEAAVFHEMLGHKGLQNLFSEELDDVLNGLLVNAPEFRQAAEAWVARETNPETGQAAYGGDLTRAAEEVLAEMSERGVIKPSLMQKLRAVVEQFARRVGIKKTFSDNDIMMILANAHRTVVDGKGGRGLPSQNISGMRYMTGWHGSPHDFDQFLTKFMGSGEGAQAFGWGLYFAEERGIAENYRDTLTYGQAGPVFKIGNKEAQGTSKIVMILEDEFYARHPEAHEAQLWLDALGDYIRYKGRPPLVAEELINYAETTYRFATTDFANPSNSWIREGLDSPERFRNIDLLLDMVDELGVSKEKKGKLYQVELPDDGVWLDLDKPIKDQSPEVKKSLQAMGWEPDFITTKGKEWVTEKLPRKYGSPKEVSQQLRMYGITGNKYLDGKSRMSGEGTRNYVVFDDSDVKVVNKYMRKGKNQREDRAGNLNLSRIQTGPDVKKYLKETADKFPTNRTTRQEIKDLATELKMSPAEVKNLSKRMVRADEVHAARMTVLRSAEEVEDMARKYIKGELNDREKVQFGLKAARHAAIQEALMDITSEAGRVLNIFNEAVRTSDTGDVQYMLRGMPNDMLRTPEFLDELANKIIKNPKKTHKITREAFQPQASDYFWSLWYNAMLSRPTTHIANIAGTLMNTTLSLANYGGAALIGQTRRFNQTRKVDLNTGYRLLEASEQVRAQVRNRGLTPELNKQAQKQADEMRNRALAIIDANDRVTGREVAARLFGAIAGIKGGFINAPKAFVLGMPLHKVSRVEHQTAILPGALTALETPVRFMAATDEFFRNIIQLSDYYGQAMRRAVGEGRTGKDMVDRVTQLVENPTKDMLTSAANYAQVIQFLDDPSGVGRKIEQLRTKKPSDTPFVSVARGGLRLFVPFIRSPDSLIRTAIRYSPIGAFGTDRYNVADIAAGGGRKDLAQARVAMGTMLALYIAWLAENGQISGEGPSDYRKREELETTGWRPNSVLVDGQWVSYQGFEPVSIPVNVVATTAERIKEAEGKAAEKGGYIDPANQTMDNAFAGILGLSEALSNNTWTESLYNLIGLTSGSQGKGSAAAQNAVAGLAASVVPAVVRGYTQDVEDTTRRVTTGDGSIQDRVVGRIQASIPGQSEKLPPARDVFGREIVREGSPEIPFIGQEASNFINRSKKSTVSTDPVDVELDRLTKGKVGTVIGKPDKNDIKTWEGTRDLSAEEYSEYVRISGQDLYYWMSEFIQTPEYKSMTDEEKIKVIQKERNRIRKLTREMLFGTPDRPPVDLQQGWQVTP